MSAERLPQQIDPIKFAENRHYLDGFLAMSEMPRLKVMCHPGAVLGSVKFSVEGGVDSFGYRFIKGKVEADVPLTCQRCLSVVHYNLAGEFSLSPVKNESEREQLPSFYEALNLSPEGKENFLDLIEEELLLLLPLVPKHDEESCSASLDQQKGGKEPETPGRISPFAKLAGLKKMKE